MSRFENFNMSAQDWRAIGPDRLKDPAAYKDWIKFIEGNFTDKNLKEFELEKMKSEIEFTSEQIESLDLDDSIKGIMSRLDARLKEVEVEVKHREMGQRDRELDIKEMEATNKATQLAKQTNGRSNGK